MNNYDVIVIGGGHAGAEACMAAARLGCRVLLLTSNLETIGQMSCNPAIGGIAKGTVVREVDALGGVMGRAADRATIQFRMLNRSKGPAVWSPRAQCDRALYRRAVRALLESHPRIEFLQGTAAQLIIEGQRVCGVRTVEGRELRSRAVILTAGTFLRGRIHIGTELRIPGGRAGDPAATHVAEQIEALGLRVGRFKTGTPPRIDGRSVRYEALERQDGEWDAYRFSHFERADRQAQVPCWLTWTSDKSKALIQKHLRESALYGGAISTKGPRYCPSVEDKVVKFPDAPRHQIFLEPEGLDTAEMYVNGLSTSLPPDVQLAVLHSIPGLEDVRMTRAGYAIEYDFYDPTQLAPWLELKELEFLFFAGQINGTTGYEEAAGQGIVAGINAARRVAGKEPIVIGRDKAYLGVLIDDLVTRGVDEPYRLFTSRSEFRLLLRQDNAISRLGELGSALGIYSAAENLEIENRLRQSARLRSFVDGERVAPESVNGLLSTSGETVVKEPVRVRELAKRPRVDFRTLVGIAGFEDHDSMSLDIWAGAEIEFKYNGYIERERTAAAKLSDMASFTLKADTPYEQFLSVSFEARQKLSAIRPASLSQAARIPGVSPSDLQNVVMEVSKRRS